MSIDNPFQNVEDESFNKRRYYRKRTLIREQQEIKMFEQAVQNGDFPKKCLKCIKATSYCRFWQTNFNCEPFDIQQEIDKLEALGV